MSKTPVTILLCLCVGFCQPDMQFIQRMEITLNIFKLFVLLFPEFIKSKENDAKIWLLILWNKNKIELH